MQPIQTILFTTDFSTRSSLAFHFAVAIARDASARLIVLHVREAGHPGGSSESSQDIRNKLYRHHAGGSPFLIEHRLAVGNPAETILRMAAEEESDLIVMASQRRNVLKRRLVGDIAERVMREAHCPVVLVKAPLRAESGPVANPDDEAPVELLGNDVVLVTEGVTPDFAARSTRVYHRDFPEVVGEGDTPAEGATHLRDRLVQAREYPQARWKSDVVERAIRDVEAFRVSIVDKRGTLPGLAPTGQLAASTHAAV